MTITSFEWNYSRVHDYNKEAIINESINLIMSVKVRSVLKNMLFH
jgi:hypothetical protein